MSSQFMKFVSRLLVLCMLALPFSSHAGMIPTDQIAAAQQQDARGVVTSYLARADVQSELQALGISPDSAKDRVAAMTDEEVDAYVASGEPADKAGAYALQGLGGLFVERISGTPSNVIGLPLRLVRALGSGLDFLL